MRIDWKERGKQNTVVRTEDSSLASVSTTSLIELISIVISQSNRQYCSNLQCHSIATTKWSQCTHTHKRVKGCCPRIDVEMQLSVANSNEVHQEGNLVVGTTKQLFRRNVFYAYHTDKQSKERVI